MHETTIILTPLLVALVAVALIHPKTIQVALKKDIVDNPNARKLQKRPIPVLGGCAVFFGIMLGVICSQSIQDCSVLFSVIAAMMIMLYTGTMDDILDLSPALRFALQIGTACLLIFLGDFKLNDFHGLWGVGKLPDILSVPLTIFASVGIVNALNLIDGVDGLSTGFCLLASTAFGTLFLLGEGNEPFAILAMAVIGALIPFFLHNVFGSKSKMFIGDGGTLVMGIVMTVFVIRIIQSPATDSLLTDRGYSPVAFTLAVLSIPVFDTLRVMTTRILKGRSPFHPDKTHMHHLFIELGLSHIMTTLNILGIYLIIVLSWVGAAASGMSAGWQTCLVILLALLFTTGLYIAVQLLKERAPGTFVRIREYNHRVRPRREGVFLWLQHIMDKI